MRNSVIDMYERPNATPSRIVTRTDETRRAIAIEERRARMKIGVCVEGEPERVLRERRGVGMGRSGMVSERL
jgi:hypothetical protein